MSMDLKELKSAHEKASKLVVGFTLVENSVNELAHGPHLASLREVAQRDKDTRGNNSYTVLDYFVIDLESIKSMEGNDFFLQTLHSDMQKMDLNALENELRLASRHITAGETNLVQAVNQVLFLLKEPPINTPGAYAQQEMLPEV